MSPDQQEKKSRRLASPHAGLCRCYSRQSSLPTWDQNEALDRRNEELEAHVAEWEQTIEGLTQSNALLQIGSRRFQELFQGLPVACFSYDAEGRVFEWNRAFETMYGLQSEDIFQKTFWDIICAPEEVEEARRTVAQVFAGQSFERLERRNVRGDGTECFVLCSTFPLRGPDGAITGAISANADITARKVLEAERERLLAEALERADRDPLTGLLNHRAFHKRLDEESDRALREGRPLAVAVMDLDNFKFFNDAYGHAVGDDVLRKVANVLRSCCRSYDTLARYGGDEFALLMPGLAMDEAAMLASRLRDALEGVGYRPPGYNAVIPLNLTVGVAIFPDDGPGRLDALEIADARLIRLKSGGDSDTDPVQRLQSLLPHLPVGFSMLNALVAAVDNKDRYTRRHSEDVLTYCLQIAHGLGLDEKAQQTLTVAALLHDVGKIGVPDYILRKPGRLTPEEYAAIQQHPTMGSVIVGAVSGFAEMLDAIHFHHENWDGTGYPSGMSGERIPLSARIMAVADAFSAMTTTRPYRKGMPPEDALAVLEAGSGKQWDPACVAAFLAARQFPTPQITA